MRTHLSRSQLVLGALASIFLATWESPAGAVSSDRAAAIVTFPSIVVDGSRGVNTWVQLANRGTTPVDVACFYEDTNKHCQNSGDICDDNEDCPSDVCLQGWQSVDFALRLTEGQPVAWHASGGAFSLPLPANQGLIPPVPENPFRGLLRCLVVDELGAPTDRNVLSGVATIERYEAGGSPALDAARYNAVGIEAIAGANNGDNELVLGGPAAEYGGCPGTVQMNHFFDFAIDPMTHGSQIFTELILVPCTGDFFFQQPGGAVVQFLVYNEFEQRFSTSRPVVARHDGQISHIDTTQANRSIFSAGVSGTLTGQTRLSSFGAGVIGVAVERHLALGQPAGTSASAAFNLHSEGERAEADILLVGEPPLCRVAPATGCRLAGTSSLSLRDRSDDASDELAWRWRRGQSTTPEDLGDPTSTTSYGLCLYAGPDQTLISASKVDPSPTGWEALGTKGYKFSDGSGAEDGIERIVLRSSRSDRSRALVDAAGQNLPLPLLPLQTPLKVQLVNDQPNVCFEAEYEAGDVIRNEPERFKARIGH